MTYEFAKKLKNAGFPQTGQTDLILFCGIHKKFSSSEDYRDTYPHEYEELYFPNLSELIEACGEKFSSLEQMVGDAKDYDWVKERGSWHAEYQVGILPEDCVSGFTPEEAVANLWLELNEK